MTLISPPPPSAPADAPLAGMTLSRLDHPAAIGQLLQDMQAQQSVASLYDLPGEALADACDALHGAAPEGAALLGLASLQALDAPARRIRWRLGAAVTPPPDAVLAIVAMAGGVRVQQVLRGAWQADGAGWLLDADWPHQLLQLQRRRHPRISVPLGQSYSASFLFGSRRSTLDIDDLSQGGLALRGSRAEMAMLFVGKKLPRVQLQLAGTTVQADLQVRARRSYKSFLLGEQVLAGCSIEAMDAADRDRLAALLGSGQRPPQA